MKAADVSAADWTRGKRGRRYRRAPLEAEAEAVARTRSSAKLRLCTSGEAATAELSVGADRYWSSRRSGTSGSIGVAAARRGRAAISGAPPPVGRRRARGWAVWQGLRARLVLGGGVVAEARSHVGYAGTRRTPVADARHAPVMPLPRHGAVVEDAAERAGIGLDDVEVQIDDDDNLLGSGLCGYTNPPGTIIILYPDAFSSVEELVKTLGHERMHVYQARVFGPPSDSADGARRERAAVDSEEMWWQSYRGKL